MLTTRIWSSLYRVCILSATAMYAVMRGSGSYSIPSSMCASIGRQRVVQGGVNLSSREFHSATASGRMPRRKASCSSFGAQQSPAPEGMRTLPNNWDNVACSPLILKNVYCEKSHCCRACERTLRSCRRSHTSRGVTCPDARRRLMPDIAVSSCRK